MAASKENPDIKDPFGNITGLKANQVRRLGKLHDRRVRPWQLISPELARTMCELASETGRQLGVLLDRGGYVRWVIVGNAHRLYLPDIGRIRGHRARLRGLRLVHVHLHDEPLSRDDLSDLSLLRLDYMAAISVAGNALPGTVRGAYLLPGDVSREPWGLEQWPDPYEVDTDFLSFVTELEAEFAAKARVADSDTTREKVILVDVAQSIGDGQDHLAELIELARTANVEVVGTVLQVRSKPDRKYLIGRGKIEEVITETMQKNAEVIIFGRDLSPAQARAIADLTELRVLDRTQLILDIFAKRAMSRDGKLQVELAQLRYSLPRLTAQDSGLSRLVGRIGGRGPGETKLEIDRRRARERINKLEKEIEKLSKRRAVQRAQRQRNHLPVAALVGYTNAGKSTLLNQLTHSDAFVEDKLFATLDTTSRRLRFPRDRQVILIDTVGFIRDLPADLAKAFRATLEELQHADLLLHVVDAADEHMEDKIGAVRAILSELDLSSVPTLMILNKTDLLAHQQTERLCQRLGATSVSALKKQGLKKVLRAMEEIMWRQGIAPKGMIFASKRRTE